MTEQRGPGSAREGAYDPATLREWARKSWLRRTMRTDALTPHELKTLDERLARWKADQQHACKLPPDWQLKALQPAVQREFRQGRDEARPLFTAEEQRAVDASRAAVRLRDRIDAREDHGPALSQLATQYMVANAVGALDARKAITERFAALHGRSVADYAREQRRADAPGRESAPREWLFPAALAWEKYEPAARRLAAHDALLYVARRDGLLTNQEYHERRRYRDRWMAEQQKRGRLPSMAEMRKSSTPVNELVLPYKKQIGRQEAQKRLGEEGAYWRRIDELAGYLKQEIDESRRYARVLDDFAISAASAYRHSVERVKRDIEQRFTLRYLDTPAEHLEARLEQDQVRSRSPAPESSRKNDERGKAGTSARPRGSRDHHDRER